MARRAHVRITVNKDEPIEKALRKFKRLCERIGIKKICKAKRYYEKPSEARRQELRKAERNRRKLIRGGADQKNKFQNNKEWMFTHPKLMDEN